MRYSLILLAFISACTPGSKKDDALNKKKVNVLEESFISTIIIFPLDETITLASVKAKELLPQFQQTEEIPDRLTFNGYTVTYSKPGEEEFSVPNPDEMSAALTGLSEEEIKSLANTKANLVFTFFGTSEEVTSKQRLINDLISSILQNKNAFALDLSTFEMFGPEAWKTNRVDNFKDEQVDITGQVTLHIYREEEFCRVVSLGMNKFCLPEISFKDITCSDGNSFGSLMNATIQSLYESPFIQGDSTFNIDIPKIKNSKVRASLSENIKKGIPQKATIQLTSAEPEEGDNPFTQLRIKFDSQKGSSQEQSNELIDLLFGTTDSITYIKHNEELLQASEEAKSKLPKLQKLFQKGLQPGYSIMVKVPFQTHGDGNEWMWVEVTKWNSSKMEGILQNDPYEIPDLKAGALVKFEEADIFDYILNKPDGSSEGNETSKIIEKMN